MGPSSTASTRSSRLWTRRSCRRGSGRPGAGPVENWWGPPPPRRNKPASGAARRRPGHREPLFPGVREALHVLSRRDNVLIGMATGKSRRGVDAVLAREGLRPFFATIQTADTHPSKPHPSMILAAMAEAGSEARGTVMIGDTTYDIEMARQAGVGAIGVGWGGHSGPALGAAGR